MHPDDSRMAFRRDRAAADRGRDAATPTDIPPVGWKDVLSRVRRQLAENNLSITAAGVAFYGLIASVPGLLSLFGLYALVFSREEIAEQFAFLARQLQPQAGRLLVALLEGLATMQRPQLGLGIAGGLLVTVWGTSLATRALIRALNLAYGEKETRSLPGRTLVALGFAALVLAVAFCIALVLIALPAFSGLHWSAHEQLWASYARWPCVAAILWLALLGVYRFGPSRAPPKWSWVSWGAMIAVALWMAGSLVLGSVIGGTTLYQHMYGAVGTVLLVLVWFLLTAYVVLLGAEINGELERQTRRDTTAGPARPLGRRGARAADTVGGSTPQTGRGRNEQETSTHRSRAAAHQK